jgi:hypothetical protein
MRNCADSSSILLLDCLTITALRDAWIIEAETRTATIAKRQSPARRVIFH